MPLFEVGQIPVDTLGGPGYVSIIHGGAVPGDTVSDLANVKSRALERALGCAAAEFNFSLPLLDASIPRPVTRAEEVALLAAGELEENPLFNAGMGAKLQADGVARVSASFMESVREKISGVVNVEGVIRPSELAYSLQFERFCTLDSTGTADLAKKIGLPKTNIITPESRARWQAQLDEEGPSGRTTLGKGTIGSVAADAKGSLAAVTSTGGVGNETVGRIGDSATVSGNYCSANAGVSCTGFGEQISNLAFAASIATKMKVGLSLEEAMKTGIDEAKSKQFCISAIALAYSKTNKSIHWAVASTDRASFAWALQTPRKIISFMDYL